MLRLKKPWRRHKKKKELDSFLLWRCVCVRVHTEHKGVMQYCLCWVSPCSLRRRARHNGTQMRCPRIPYTEAPYRQSLWERHTCIIIREKCNNKVQNKVKYRGEQEWGMVLTGERASETTRSFGHCGMVVGCGWHCCDLGNWSVVYFRKLKDHSRWRISSPLLPSLLQGPNFLKGDTLWGWRLRVGGGRLGLVSTWGAARTRAGTAWWTSIQDNTTLRDRQGQRVSSLIFS